jgi:hypothetical protein
MHKANHRLVASMDRAPRIRARRHPRAAAALADVFALNSEVGDIAAKLAPQLLDLKIWEVVQTARLMEAGTVSTHAAAESTPVSRSHHRGPWRRNTRRARRFA